MASPFHKTCWSCCAMILAATCLHLFVNIGRLSAQEAKDQPKPATRQPADASKPEPLRPIATEPESIDSATLVDPKLRQKVTVDFVETSLTDVAAWLQQQTGFNVTLDTRSLDPIGIDANSPISEKLVDQPIYLLLDRLHPLNIGWRLNGGVFVFHAVTDESMLYNVQYNVGKLLDDGFLPRSLRATLQKCIVTRGGWIDDGGNGDLVQLGDVLFIRQDSRTHRRIAGLLAGLATPARRVLIDDPAPHEIGRAHV